MAVHGREPIVLATDFTTGLFDLDDLGPHVREQLRPERAREEPSAVENANTCEWSDWLGGHVLVPYRFESIH